jgi:medium-chain acyl-[acyl-carrier-protein] hydrolase
MTGPMSQLTPSHRLATTTLLCIPHAGGGASAYRRWSEALTPVNVAVLQLPGREGRFREPLAYTLDAVIDDLFRAAEPHLDGRFGIYGHSMGGLMGFELAHAIRARTGREPARLFVSAARSPQHRQLDEPLSDLTDGDFIDEIVRRYKGVPAAILQDADFMASVLPALRADFGILERYRCADRAPLRCPISAFGGSSDDVIVPSSIAGWADQTIGAFNLEMVDGEHFFLQQQRLRIADTILTKLRVETRDGDEGSAPETERECPTVITVI